MNVKALITALLAFDMDLNVLACNIQEREFVEFDAMTISPDVVEIVDLDNGTICLYFNGTLLDEDDGR